MGRGPKLQPRVRSAGSSSSRLELDQTCRFDCVGSLGMWDRRPVTPQDPRVSGWVPDFIPADTQFDRHADRLRSLVDDQVADAWVVWSLDHDEWFADLPVVLQMNRGPQVEVCWQKFDDLSITWGTIDVTQTPRAWVDWPLEWRRQALPALASVVGADVRNLAASSFVFSTQNVDPPHEVSKVWLTTGLWFGTASGGSTSSMRSTRTVFRPNCQRAMTSTAGGLYELRHACCAPHLAPGA